MLINFRASDFLSIDAPVEFSMLASKESQHLGRVAEEDGLPAMCIRAKFKVLQTTSSAAPHSVTG